MQLSDFDASVDGDAPLSETEPVRPARAIRPFQTIFASCAFTLLWAAACGYLLELSLRPDPGGQSGSIVANPMFYLDSIFVWVVLVLLVSISNRLWLSAGFLLCTVLLVSVATRTKIEFRREPLYPSDVDFVQSPSFLITMASPGQLIAAALASVAILIGAVLTGRRLDRRMPRIRRTGSPHWWWGILTVRVVIAALCLALLYSATRFNTEGNPWRRLYESSGAQWRPWNQHLNYLENGFVGGLLYNMPTPAMEMPPGYDRTAMDAISERYERVAERLNHGRQPGAFAHVNVVVILDESFSDPTRLSGFELERDPIPNTRAIMAESRSGTMLAQLYGSGTANMEFETLTGQSLALFAPQMNTPYQMLVPDYSSYPSVVSWFESRGHVPIAIHPYVTSLYKRSEVYDVFGFDRFVHAGSIGHTANVGDGQFISDHSAFLEVLDQVQSTDKPVFANVVTMQNHIPVEDSYDDPIGVTGTNEDQAARIGQYARGLEYTDQALEEFLGDLRRSPERTVVVFYGDHLPGIYDEKVRADQKDLALNKTPFFIWDSMGQSPRSLPLTSPTNFMPLLFDLVGEPLPPFYALLSEVRARFPAMEQGRLVTPAGRVLTEQDLSESDRALLDDFRMVQYDLSVGERFSFDRMWDGS